MTDNDTAPAPAPIRSGRRPGKSETRAQILDGATGVLAERFCDEQPFGSIAAAADVDPAMIHHHFGSKEQLFTAAIALPMDPCRYLGPVHASPSETGENLLEPSSGVWESEHQAGDSRRLFARRFPATDPD